ncbi:MAG TPA: histidinol dehydrogenase, partial [bacterium]|nr:histidinol dehydrogenase [bacterium]
MMRIIKAADIPASFYEYREIAESDTVRAIIDDVKRRGDEAVRFYTETFDLVKLSDLRVPESELEKGLAEITPELKKALELAAGNIRRFAEAQRKGLTDMSIETMPGVIAGQRVIPVERAGIYAPGGRFPLPSSVLMGVIPALAAGVKEVALFTPPRKDGTILPAIRAAALIAGCREVYRVGGVQAVAAMAYGTATIRPVQVIAGPGNRFVAAAKKQVYGAVGIDFIAGPSEVLIIADDSADPRVVAADLLAQAEHDPDASAILLTTSGKLAQAVAAEVERQLALLPTAGTARPSIEDNGLIVLCDSLDDAVTVANKKAPEHLELDIRDAEKLVPRLTNYGALFIGARSAEALGDYAAGPNHTLPTGGAARYTGGLS